MSRIYPLGLVGESNYQAAIRQCSEGERVYICHERDNPYDDLALKVETRSGQTIGYIARSSWIRNAIHDEGRGATATVLSVKDAGTGVMGVVINVTLTDDDILERKYKRAPAETTGSANLGTLEKMLRGIFSR